MKNFFLIFFAGIFAALFIGIPAYAYLRDADLTTAQANIAVTYSKIPVEKTDFLNYCFEYPVDHETTWGMMYGRSYGQLDGYDNFEASMNFLWYRDQALSMSGVFGGMILGDYSQNTIKSMVGTVEVKTDKWQTDQQHVFYPELGVSFSYSPIDVFSARLNLTLGLQAGVEFAFRPQDYLEMSVGVILANEFMYSLKYLF